MILDPILNPILARFNYNLPLKPYCTNDFNKYGIHYTEKEQAVRHRYIQPCFGIEAYVRLDVDHDNTYWYDHDLPQPTIRTINRENGHSHWLYELKEPVYTWSRANPKIANWFKQINKGFTIQADADPGYNGLLTKNPLIDHWIVATWDNRYTLGELNECIRADTQEQLIVKRKQADKAESAPGRNCHLFDHGRFFAYPIAREHKLVGTLYTEILDVINQENTEEFPNNPLPSRECEQIAHSIAQWTWPRRFDFKIPNKVKDIEDLKERQSKSAEATNQKRKDKTRETIRKAVAELEAEGQKITGTAVIKKSGLSRRTVYQHSDLWKK